METLALVDLLPVLPEIVMAVGAMVLLMVGAFGGEKSYQAVSGLAIILLLATAVVVVLVPHEGEALFGLYVTDGFARFFKILTLVGTAASIVIAGHYLSTFRVDRFEYPVLAVLAALGMMAMISANDLISLYVGLELQSLALYVMASFKRDNARASEAGLKYFVLGALSSGLLLYGASLVYGFTGTTRFPDLIVAFQSEPAIGAIVGLAFLLSGIAFKISAVPFHMWTPDVYEGAPTPVTAFFSAVPKIAAFGLMMRVVVDGFGPLVDQWQQIVVFISIASMLWGAFAAIVQTNIKRLMAYSSIGNVGYALVGLSAGTEAGYQSVAIYMAIYMVSTLGVFACILAMRREGSYVEDIADLAGLSKRSPLLALALLIFMFSMAGIPPLAGFFSKFYVFSAAIDAGLVPLAVIGVLSSVVSAYYYLRIVKIVYFDEPAPAFEPLSGELRLVVTATGLYTVAFPLIPGTLLIPAGIAAASLLN